MSHHIYQTKAYVIESTEAGEANRRLSLLTEDLGLISVAAQGVRLTQSKLKYSIQDLSFLKVSVVRGKEVWRLTNAEKLISLYDRRLPVSVRRVLAYCLSFIKRLTPEDVKYDELFNLMTSLSNFCFTQKKIAETYTKELIRIFEVRTLAFLGYGSSDPRITKITDATVFDEEVCMYAKEQSEYIDSYIEEALRQSHL